MKKLLTLLLCACLSVALTGCFEKKEEYVDIPNPIATITMASGDVMRFELCLSAAPITVANFCELANQFYYDGLFFYRVVPGVLIQSGSMDGSGTDDAGYTIKGEFSSNGVANSVSHLRGAISMARREGEPDSASSIFFIMQGSYPEYDGKYAAFGVAMDEETLQTIDKIGSTAVDGNYSPLAKQQIRTVRVNTHGYDLSAPHIAKGTK